MEKIPDPIVTINNEDNMQESMEIITLNSSDSKKFKYSSSPGHGHQTAATSPSQGMMGQRLPGYLGPGPMVMPPSKSQQPIMNIHCRAINMIACQTPLLLALF